MSLAELERRQWAFYKQQEDQGRRIQALAWWIAALSRQTRLPSLAVLLNPARNPTPEEKAELDAYTKKLEEEMGSA